MKPLLPLALAIAALSLTTPAGAQAPASDAAARAAAAAGTGSGPVAEAIDGEVRKVDLDAKKLTLRHGPIAAFDMPGMTMVFEVRDPKALNGLKTGDKVRFKVDKIGGKFTVIELEPVR